MSPCRMQPHRVPQPGLRQCSPGRCFARLHEHHCRQPGRRPITRAEREKKLVSSHDPPVNVPGMCERLCSRVPVQLFMHQQPARFACRCAVIAQDLVDRPSIGHAGRRPDWLSRSVVPTCAVGVPARCACEPLLSAADARPCCAPASAVVPMTCPRGRPQAAVAHAPAGSG